MHSESQTQSRVFAGTGMHCESHTAICAGKSQALVSAGKVMHCEPSFGGESNAFCGATVFAGKVMHCESQTPGLAGGLEIVSLHVRGRLGLHGGLSLLEVGF